MVGTLRRIVAYSVSQRTSDDRRAHGIGEADSTATLAMSHYAKPSALVLAGAASRQPWASLGPIPSLSLSGTFILHATSSPSLESNFYQARCLIIIGTEGGGGKVAFDDICNRAPEGEAQIVANCFRIVQHSNWKIFLENQLDALHPSITHHYTPEQETGERVPNIFYEDLYLMEMRIRRLNNFMRIRNRPGIGPATWFPNVVIQSEDRATGYVICTSRFHMVEYRLEAQRYSSGANILTH